LARDEAATICAPSSALATDGAGAAASSLLGALRVPFGEGMASAAAAGAVGHGGQIGLPERLRRRRRPPPPPPQQQHPHRAQQHGQVRGSLMTSGGMMH